MIKPSNNKRKKKKKDLEDGEVLLEDLVVEGGCEDGTLVFPERPTTCEKTRSEPVIKESVDEAFLACLLSDPEERKKKEKKRLFGLADLRIGATCSGSQMLMKGYKKRAQLIKIPPFPHPNCPRTNKVRNRKKKKKKD